MKRIILFVSALLGLIRPVEAQPVPQGIPYQAVAHNARGEALAHREISLRVTFLAGGEEGKKVYEETHAVQTDAQGYFSIVIGGGTGRSADFTTVPWSAVPIWLIIAIDPGGQGEYIRLRNSPLLAVPYAFQSATAHRLAAPGEKDDIIRHWTIQGNDEIFDTAFVGHRNVEKSLHFKTNDQGVIEILPSGVVRLDSFESVGGLLIEAEDKYRDLLIREHFFDSYPLRVQGGDQGIGIKLQADESFWRQGKNNFVCFWDKIGVHGSIETDYYAHLSPKMVLFSLFQALNTIFPTLEAIAAATPDEEVDWAEVISNTIWASMSAEILIHRNVITAPEGVRYQSGGADYAEYLSKADTTQDFKAGEIVGVHGGKISRHTENADHLLVISLNPIVIGNMPQPEKEEQYEKVAFKGQVLTRVLGPAQSGDYILPSGQNDGLGRAVHPEDMQLPDYDRVVGVAWSASDRPGLNLINVAVGFNNNDLHRPAAQQAEALEELETQLDQVIGYLANTRSDFAIAPLRAEEPAQGLAEPTLPPVAIAEQSPFTVFDPATMNFDDWIEENRATIVAQTAYLHDYYRMAGMDLEQYASVQAIFDDPVQTIKDVHSGAFLERMLDRIKSAVKPAATDGQEK